MLIIKISNALVWKKNKLRNAITFATKQATSIDMQKLMHFNNFNLTLSNTLLQSKQNENNK